jgi:hypothetical protein
MRRARLWILLSAGTITLLWSAGAAARAPARTITEAECTAAKLGDSIPVSAIGEPVSTTWNGRAVQLGGGGMNGTIPMLAGPPLAQGYVTYGSDSGHQASFGRGPREGLQPPSTIGR